MYFFSKREMNFNMHVYNFCIIIIFKKYFQNIIKILNVFLLYIYTQKEKSY